MAALSASAALSVAQALAAQRAGIPRREARLLLQHVLGCSHATLAAHPERVLTPAQQAQFHVLAQRRGRGEPLAYLIGNWEFYGRRFRITAAVLIPRPETELLVEVALERLRGRSAPRVLDLGSGSGVLAITLALERPDAQVTGIDRSRAALALARDNALVLEAQVRFLESDWFGAVRSERFDLIVANPPYVAAGDPHLTVGDLPHEPPAALTDGSTDGLASLRAIAAAAPNHLAPGGSLAVEHGYDQAASVAALLRSAGLSNVISTKDISGIMRVAVGSLVQAE